MMNNETLLILLSISIPACLPGPDVKDDPNCQEYVAVPGEPCKKGLHLLSMPRQAAICVCNTHEGK